ncbi:hypothetical protein [Acidicapsa ligni]|uniref:hypothetical protein n=1 Tax=Acidicapsa ligni TaxID=542300 RepID=UPI0021DF8301|nr:hypothetical protein [Acidicapsa ligni]
MLLELAKPASLLASIVSLCAVFHAAFLGTETNLEARLWNIIGILALAAVISFLSGEIFRKSTPTAGSLHSNTSESLASTFPVQIFFWSTGTMLVLFLAAWYLETHIIFYKDIRY